MATFTTDPQRAGEEMIEACRLGLRRTTKVLSVNLLKGLRRRRVGTHAEQNMATLKLSQSKETTAIYLKESTTFVC